MADADGTGVDLSKATVEELNAELIRKTAGADALDGLFTLPVLIKDPVLRDSYEVIVARMRREASHIQMNTIQQLLMERIALNYIVLRYRESQPTGDEQGFTHAGVQKDFNTFWLTMTREFNELLARFRPSDKDAVMGMVKQAVEEILATLPAEHSAIRNELAVRFVETFKREGLIKA